MKPKITINQAGYIPDMPKTASFTGTGSLFVVIDAKSDRIFFAADIPSPIFDSASGDNVSVLDFSTLKKPGSYYIKAGNIKSCVFEIRSKPYIDVRKALLKGFYYSRCGKLQSKFAGEYAHPACHIGDVFLYENPSKKIEASGGWHISGSYSKYVTLSCLTLGHLLYAYKLFPQTFSCSTDIPESGNGIPDILNESRLELEWLLKMQARDGGVYHKLCSLEPTEFILPQNDKMQRYVFPRSHQATANFTAVTALASTIYRQFDSDFADILQDAAFKSWIWLVNNPEYSPFENPDEISYFTTGDIADKNFNDDLFWAVCELYSICGESDFHDLIKMLYSKIGNTCFSVCKVGGFGITSYCLCEHDTSPEIMHRIKTDLRITADNLYSISQNSGYGTAALPEEYTLDSNVRILSGGILMMLAYRILKCDEYRDAAAEQLHYLLGKNPLGISFVTGVGSVCVKYPHHRPSAFDDIDEPVPGLAVNGPNINKTDDYSRWNIPKNTPPAKCYFDSGLCYASNEPMLYCNSAAILLAAFLDSL